MAYNLSPCISQDPNKTKTARSNLGKSGKLTYKEVARVLGHNTVSLS